MIGQEGKVKATESPPFDFKVILPTPRGHPLRMMPPAECKVAQEPSPREKHLLKVYEKRGRMKALKSSGKLSRSKHIGLEQRAESLRVPKLDKVVHLEASDGDQLDLKKNQLLVKKNFRV